MAEIKTFDKYPYGIQGFIPEDTYDFDTENRPLKNLTINDIMINDQLDNLILKKPLETPDGERRIFSLPEGERARFGFIMVFLNGVKYPQNGIEMLNSYTKFKIKEPLPAPAPDDELLILYHKEPVSHPDGIEAVRIKEGQLTIRQV